MQVKRKIHRTIKAQNTERQIMTKNVVEIISSSCRYNQHVHDREH